MLCTQVWPLLLLVGIGSDIYLSCLLYFLLTATFPGGLFLLLLLYAHTLLPGSFPCKKATHSTSYLDLRSTLQVVAHLLKVVETLLHLFDFSFMHSLQKSLRIILNDLATLVHLVECPHPRLFSFQFSIPPLNYWNLLHHILQFPDADFETTPFRITFFSEPPLYASSFFIHLCSEELSVFLS